MTGETYTKEFLNDTYEQAFASFRDQYSERVQQLLCARKVDENPTPNATTIIYFDNGPDGEITVTNTGDFVRYFNRRCGDDRIEQTRLALEEAARKAKEQEQSEGKQRAKAVASKKPAVRRFARPRLSFMQGVFAMMLVLSLSLLGFTSFLLESTSTRVAELDAQIAVLEADLGASDALRTAQSTDVEEPNVFLSLNGESSVEIYPVEEQSVGLAALLDALANLGK